MAMEDPSLLQDWELSDLIVAQFGLLELDNRNFSVNDLEFKRLNPKLDGSFLNAQYTQYCSDMDQLDMKKTLWQKNQVRIEFGVKFLKEWKDRYLYLWPSPNPPSYAKRVLQLMKDVVPIPRSLGVLR